MHADIIYDMNFTGKNRPRKSNKYKANKVTRSRGNINKCRKRIIGIYSLHNVTNRIENQKQAMKQYN